MKSILYITKYNHSKLTAIVGEDALLIGRDLTVFLIGVPIGLSSHSSVMAMMPVVLLSETLRKSLPVDFQ